MKKWIIIGLILLGLLLWQAIDLLWSAQADKNEDKEEYLQYVEQETGLTLERTERFHGEQFYYVFTGVDEQDHTHYVFINEAFDMQLIAEEDVNLSREDAGALALQEYAELEEVHRITPAYTGNQFCWEVLAVDEERNLQYFYYTMEEGMFQKRYTLGD